MRISGHKLKRAAADLTPPVLAQRCSKLGLTMTADSWRKIEAFPSTELEEWEATIMAAVCGAPLSALEISPPAKIDQLTADVAWLKLAVAHLARQTPGHPLPLDATPDQEHYYLHTPGEPKPGCPQCMDHFGGPPA